VWWWLNELAGLVPAQLHQFYHQRGVTVALLLDGTVGQVFIETAKSAEQVYAFDCSRGSTDHARQAIARRLRQGPKRFGGNRRYQLRIPARAALRTTMTLPVAAEENLREVVGYELDRHTPFTAARVYLAIQQMRRDGDNGQIELEIVVVPRMIVDQASSLAVELGFAAEEIVVAGATPEERPSRPLELDNEPMARSPIARTAPALLGAAALACLAATIYLPLWKMQGELGEVNARLAGVSRAATDAARLQKEIAALEADGRFVGDRKRSTPPATLVLAEVTRLLPDDTWITELQMNGADLQLQGSSVSASALIALLEQSSMMKGAAFRAPTTQDPASGREWFHIATQLQPQATK
jgi:general secretion pathway protein L